MCANRPKPHLDGSFGSAQDRLRPVTTPIAIPRLCCGEGGAGGDAAQFEHPMTDVAVFGQMGGSNGFTAASHHLVERAAVGELRVELAAKFTRPAGARGVEATDESMVDVFHEKHLLGARFVRQSHIYSARAIYQCLVGVFVLHGMGPAQAPAGRRRFRGLGGIRARKAAIAAAIPLESVTTVAGISGMIIPLLSRKSVF